MHHETLFKSFNNNTRKTKRQKPKKKKIGNNISDIVFVIIKWKTIKNNTKKEDKELKLNVYVLLAMLVTSDTVHFDTSLLNVFADLNAAQLINSKNIEEKEQNYKQKKIEKNISVYSLK